MPDGKPTFGSNPKFFVDGEIIDRKGNAVDPGECIIFKVTDLALYRTLDCYADECNREGCERGHIRGVQKLVREVDKWQMDNKDRVKAAD